MVSTQRWNNFSDNTSEWAALSCFWGQVRCPKWVTLNLLALGKGACERWVSQMRNKQLFSCRRACIWTGKLLRLGIKKEIFKAYFYKWKYQQESGGFGWGALTNPTRCLSASFGGWYPLKICPKALESLLEIFTSKLPAATALPSLIARSIKILPAPCCQQPLVDGECRNFTQAFYGPHSSGWQQNLVREPVFVPSFSCSKLIENTMNVNDAFRSWKLEGWLICCTLYVNTFSGA